MFDILAKNAHGEYWCVHVVRCQSYHFLYPATSKSAGYYVIPSAKKLRSSVRPSVRPCVRLSVRLSALCFRAQT